MNCVVGRAVGRQLGHGRLEHRSAAKLRNADDARQLLNEVAAFSFDAPQSAVCHRVVQNNAAIAVDEKLARKFHRLGLFC